MIDDDWSDSELEAVARPAARVDLAAAAHVNITPPQAADPRCTECDGQGVIRRPQGWGSAEDCPACHGRGHHGIDPTQPITVRPGPEKVAYLQARYQAGMPLWRDGDRYVSCPYEEDGE